MEAILRDLNVLRWNKCYNLFLSMLIHEVSAANF